MLADSNAFPRWSAPCQIAVRRVLLDLGCLGLVLSDLRRLELYSTYQLIIILDPVISL